MLWRFGKPYPLDTEIFRRIAKRKKNTPFEIEFLFNFELSKKKKDGFCRRFRPTTSKRLFFKKIILKYTLILFPYLFCFQYHIIVVAVYVVVDVSVVRVYPNGIDYYNNDNDDGRRRGV